MDEEALIASRLLTKTTSISKAPPPLRALAGKLAALVAAAGKVRQGCDRAGAGVLQSAAREAGALQSDARGVAFARGEIQGRERTGRAPCDLLAGQWCVQGAADLVQLRTTPRYRRRAGRCVWLISTAATAWWGTHGP